MLPPILDIIRGCSEQEYNMMRTVHRANRPQDKGKRNYPYEDIILTRGASLFSTMLPSTAWSIDIVSQESERINELTLRVAQLEERLEQLISSIK